MSSIALTPLTTYIDLNERKQRLKDELKEIEDSLRQLESIVVDSLRELGDDEHPGHMRIGNTTIFLRSELWARPKNGDREATAHALQEAGLGWMVKEDFNINQLSAWVREVKRKGEDAEAEEVAQLRFLEDHLELTEGFKVGTRKVASKNSR